MPLPVVGSRTRLEASEAAVRVTNHNNEAVAWARCATELLDQLFQGESMTNALEAAIREAPYQSSPNGRISSSNVQADGSC